VTVFRSVSENSSANGDLILQLVQQCQQLGRTAAIREPIIHMLKKLSGAQEICTQDINTAAGITEFIMQTPELSGLSDISEAVQQASSRTSALVLDDSPEDSLLVASLNYLAATGMASSEVQNRLSELISPAQPAPIQQSALNTLLRTNSEQRVLDQWPALSPDRRNQALDAMISRETSIDILLTSVAEETLSPGDLGAVYRDQLLNHRNETIQTRSKQLLVEGTPSERVQVVADWNAKILEVNGDTAHGKAVFGKRCATCHKLQDVGNQIGANLASLRDRTTPALVAAILNPNKAVETRFMSYTAVRTDGRSVSGMLKNETSNSVTLLGTDGKPQELLRSDLEELFASNRSFMPEGLEKDLSPQDLVDVISFVQSADTPWKQQVGNSPQIVSVGEDGQFTLTAATAELYGPSITFDQHSGTISTWNSSDDYIAWKLDVKGWGTWKIEFEYACDDTTAGNQLKVATPGRMMTARVPGTGTNEAIRRWTAGTLDLAPSQNTLTVSAPEELTSSLLELKAVRLIPSRKD
jgi:putative heme-binding domain-containing protein